MSRDLPHSAACPGPSVRECGATGCYPPALPALLSATLSPALWVYLFANVGPQGLLVVRLPAPFVPHSASLGPTTATQVLSALAAGLCPSYWSGCMFLFYLLGVGLPCRWIFCQFWLCEEAQCVYLSRHLDSPPSGIFLLLRFCHCFLLGVCL